MNLCWLLGYVLLLSVMNFVYYFMYSMCEVVCVVFCYGLWLVVMLIWMCGFGGG